MLRTDCKAANSLQSIAANAQPTELPESCTTQGYGARRDTGRKFGQRVGVCIVCVPTAPNAERLWCEPPAPSAAASGVRRTAHSSPTAVHDVRVDHCRADVRMAHELLDGTDVVPCLQKVRRERVPKRVTRHSLLDARGPGFEKSNRMSSPTRTGLPDFRSTGTHSVRARATTRLSPPRTISVSRSNVRPTATPTHVRTINSSPSTAGLT